MIWNLRIVLMLPVLAAALTGCSAPPAPTTGFLSDYSRLDVSDGGTMRYVSPRLVEYQTFIVDPVELRVERPAGLTIQQRAEAARYFRTRFIDALQANGYRVREEAGAGTARVRMALTDARQATWWLSLHPISKVTGAGTGTAAMEGEVIDSVTGEQLAAVVQSGRGNQFELDTFSQLDDIRDVIDRWALEAEQRLRELRRTRVRQMGQVESR